MYAYEWDEETGGLLLQKSPLQFSKEPRPVYYKELDILGFDRYWNYAKDDTYPYMWAEANNYIYRGRKVASTKGGSCYKAPELNILEDPEPENCPLQFVNVPLMVEKNRDILEGLVLDTIKKVYNTYIEYHKKIDIFYVAFSGGKDSVVALDIVQRALPHNEFLVLFGDTGMEFPDTYEVVDAIESECKERGIKFLRSSSDLDPEYTWKQFGPPAQTIRWCCSVHKTTPQILLLRKESENPHFRGMAFTGIRGDESVSRSEYDDVSLGQKVRGQYSCHPILEWNSAELFLYIYSRNLILNTAYKKGNSRAGCLVCPLATSKNIYFKEQCYSQNNSGYKTTTIFNNIILETTSKDLSSQAAIEEFMDIGGWKARRSGRELSFSQNYCEYSFHNGVFTISLLKQSSDWREWIKTIGPITYLSNGDVEVQFREKLYHINFEKDNKRKVDVFNVDIGGNSRTDILFMSALKNVFRKTAYCIQCRVCEANCPHGFINMDNAQVHISDDCTKCQKCHDIFNGCLMANSLRVPKEDKKMGSIDRYGNMGIEYKWVIKYFQEKDAFWDSEHGLGKNMVKYLRYFLNDAEINIKGKFSSFGQIIDKIGVDESKAWALMLCNLAYTPEFNWWIKNIDLGISYTPETILSMLPEYMSKNSKGHIVSAYKNIFISNPHLSNEIGLGVPDYTLKNDKKSLNSITRGKWDEPVPEVILYSLYKFAEACGDYYQFTLSRLLNHEIESDGVSPTEIFGLDQDQMEKILKGLTFNYPEYISATFTLDLDNINLNPEKTSADVLEIF